MDNDKKYKQEKEEIENNNDDEEAILSPHFMIVADIVLLIVATMINSCTFGLLCMCFCIFMLFVSRNRINLITIVYNIVLVVNSLFYGLIVDKNLTISDYYLALSVIEVISASSLLAAGFLSKKHRLGMRSIIIAVPYVFLTIIFGLSYAQIINLT